MTEIVFSVMLIEFISDKNFRKRFFKHLSTSFSENFLNSPVGWHVFWISDQNPGLNREFQLYGLQTVF